MRAFGGSSLRAVHCWKAVQGGPAFRGGECMADWLGKGEGFGL
jgi:hypothetical protein